jgi:ribosome-binding protein aMBF1 (putative translation factor)
MNKEINRVVRPATADESARHDEMRTLAMDEFPPLDPPRQPSVKNQIAAAIRTARTDQGLSWEALAKKAGIPDSNIVRDIEYGHDAPLSNVQFIAEALGLRLQVVSASS